MTYRLEPITLGRNLFDEKEVKRIINNRFASVAKSIKIDFGVVTQTWKHKPKFTIKREGELNRIVQTDSDIFKWVSGGTKAHVIAPKDSPALVISVGFRPKTRVMVIRSNKGKRGSPRRLAAGKSVNHPGIEARKFATAIAKKWQKILPAIIERAIQTELTKQ